SLHDALPIAADCRKANTLRQKLRLQRHFQRNAIAFMVPRRHESLTRKLRGDRWHKDGAKAAKRRWPGFTNPYFWACRPMSVAGARADMAPHTTQGAYLPKRGARASW